MVRGRQRELSDGTVRDGDEVGEEAKASQGQNRSHFILQGYRIAYSSGRHFSGPVKKVPKPGIG
jgi:hypothetical protein